MPERSQADAIFFGIENAEDIVGEHMTIYLYESEGDENGDGIFDIGEYNFYTANGYTFNGSENNQIIAVTPDNGGSPVPLRKDHYYLVAMEYTDEIGQRVRFLGTNGHDYNQTEEFSFAQNKPRYGSLVDFTNDGDFRPFRYKGDYFVPAIRLVGGHIDWDCNTHELSPDNKTGIFPNPSSDILNLDMDFSENCGLVEIKIADARGKVLDDRRYQNIRKDRINFDLKNFPQGTYFLNIKTSIGERTLPFSVQR